MKKLLLFLFLFLASCSIDNNTNYIHVEKETLTGEMDYLLISEFTMDINGIEILIQDYSIINPSSNARLDMTIYRPNDEAKHSAVILVPGGLGTKKDFLKKPFSSENEYYTPEIFASKGFVTLIFSADGRGDSDGEEDYNGYIHQDGLYQLYRFLENDDKINSIGIVSYSYGIAMASGMIGRYQPELNYYIEWEGPVDRYFVTHDCENFGAVKESIDCDDNDYWNERETLRFVPYFSTKYFIIIQSENDHAQDTWLHSVIINNLAIQYLDWVRVNGPENQINQKYNLNTFPTSNHNLKDQDILSY